MTRRLIAAAVALALFALSGLDLHASLPISDDFNRADAGSLGGNYTQMFSTGGCGLTIASNVALTNTTSTNCAVRWSADTPANDQVCTIKPTSGIDGNEYVNCMVRATGTTTATSNTYFCGGSASGYFLNEVTNGTNTTLTSGSWTLASGDVISCQAVGTTISIKLNGSTVDAATDSAHASGQCGILLFDANNTGAHGDDFTCDSIPTGAGSTPRGMLLLGVGA